LRSFGKNKFFLKEECLGSFGILVVLIIIDLSVTISGVSF